MIGTKAFEVVVNPLQAKKRSDLSITRRGGVMVVRIIKQKVSDMWSELPVGLTPFSNVARMPY